MNDAQSTLDTVRARELDAALETALGRGTPAGLAEAIRSACGAEAPRRRRSVLLPAAALLLGATAVFGVAWLEHSGATTRAAPPAGPTGDTGQDPQAIAITTATVRAQFEAIEDPGPMPAEERLIALAAATHERVVVDTRFPGLGRESRVDLADCGFAEAVERIAHECGGSIRQFGRVFLVDDHPDARPPSPERARITLTAKGLTLTALGKKLHAHTGIDLVMPAARDARFDIAVEDVPWRALLAAAAKAAGLRPTGCGVVVALRPAGATAAMPLTMNTETAAPAANLLDTWALIAGQNLIVAPNLEGKFVGSLWHPARADLLATAAAVLRADVESVDANVHRLIATKDPGTTTSTTSEGMLPGDFLTFVGELDATIDASRAKPQPVAVFASRAPIIDLVRAIATVNLQKLQRHDAGYVIR